MRPTRNHNLAKGLTRRNFLGVAMAGSLAGLNGCSKSRSSSVNPKDIIVDSLQISYEDYLYRTPIKFGGNVLDRVTLLNVTSEVHDRQGGGPKGSVPCPWATCGHGLRTSCPMPGRWLP